jgi:hypothetical protein
MEEAVRMPNTSFNNLVQATPVFAILLVLSQMPGAPDQNRWVS